MVDFYNILDLILFLSIVSLSFVSYKKRVYIKIFEYMKLFIIISISAKLSSGTGVLLQKLYITKADTYTTLILIGFVVNLIIIFFSWSYIFRFLNHYISSNKIRSFFAKLFTFLEVLIIVTFSLYIFMQLYISKVYLIKTLHRSYSYPKIEKFYHSFLNDDFVNMVLSSDTGTNHKEVIFKSFKNSI
jgi:hypothetical protein